MTSNCLPRTECARAPSCGKTGCLCDNCADPVHLALLIGADSCEWYGRFLQKDFAIGATSSVGPSATSIAFELRAESLTWDNSACCIIGADDALWAADARMRRELRAAAHGAADMETYRRRPTSEEMSNCKEIWEDVECDTQGHPLCCPDEISDAKHNRFIVMTPHGGTTKAEPVERDNGKPTHSDDTQEDLPSSVDRHECFKHWGEKTSVTPSPIGFNYEMQRLGKAGDWRATPIKDVFYLTCMFDYYFVKFHYDAYGARSETWWKYCVDKDGHCQFTTLTLADIPRQSACRLTREYNPADYQRDYYWSGNQCGAP